MTLLSVAIAACSAAATTPAPPAPPIAARGAEPSPPAKSCLMTHVCGCNLGCTRIAVAPGLLRDGAVALAETGPYEGRQVRVAKETDTSGAQVFALTDRDDNGVCERALPETRSLVGFVCATKDSGSVPASACAKGCD